MIIFNNDLLKFVSDIVTAIRMQTFKSFTKVDHVCLGKKSKQSKKIYKITNQLNIKFPPHVLPYLDN